MNLKKGRCLENECFCENDNDVVEPTVVFFSKIFFSRFSLLVLSNKEFQTKLQIFFKNIAFAHSIFNYRSMNPNLEKQKFYLPSKDFQKYLITFKMQNIL